jgi:membrane dipeptidase
MRDGGVTAKVYQLGVDVEIGKDFRASAQLAAKPPVVSHGTARELGSRRVRAIADRRGVIGIHFYSSYLGPRPQVRHVAEAVDELAQQGGIEVVALGIDFFPKEGAWGEFQRAQGTREISWAIPDLGRLPDITEALVRRGYRDDAIFAVLGRNFLRVCHEVFGA